jgi:hypothetical protein
MMRALIIEHPYLAVNIAFTVGLVAGFLAAMLPAPPRNGDRGGRAA